MFLSDAKHSNPCSSNRFTNLYFFKYLSVNNLAKNAVMNAMISAFEISITNSDKSNFSIQLQ